MMICVTVRKQSLHLLFCHAINEILGKISNNEQIMKQ